MANGSFVTLCCFNIAALTILFLFGGSRTDGHPFFWVEVHQYSFSASLFDVFVFGIARGGVHLVIHGLANAQTMVPIGLLTFASTAFAIVKGAMFDYARWSADGGVQLMAVVVLFFFFGSAWLEALVCQRLILSLRRERSHALAKETDHERARLLFSSINGTGATGGYGASGSRPASIASSIGGARALVDLESARGSDDLPIRRRPLSSGYVQPDAPMPGGGGGGGAGMGESRLYDDDDDEDGDNSGFRTPYTATPTTSEVSASALASALAAASPRRGLAVRAAAGGVAGESLARGGPEDYVPQFHEDTAQAYAELLAADSDAGFTPVGNAHGVEMFRRKHAASGLQLLKGRGLIDAAPDAVYALLHDTARRGEWDVMYREHEHVTVFNPYYRLTRLGFHGTGPVTGRDILVLTGSRHMRDGVIYIISYSVEDERAPPRSDYVRAHVYTGGYILKPLPGEPNRTVCTYVTCVDLKGWLMASVKNMVATNSMESIDKVRAVLARDAAR